MCHNLVCGGVCEVLAPRVRAWTEIKVFDCSLCCWSTGSRLLGRASRKSSSLHRSSSEQAVCLPPDSLRAGAQSPSLPDIRDK